MKKPYRLTVHYHSPGYSTDRGNWVPARVYRIRASFPTLEAAKKRLWEHQDSNNLIVGYIGERA